MDLDDLFSSDEDEPTAAKVLQLLTAAWINEKCCPELLRHESDVVDCMIDQIQQMEENLKGLGRDDFRYVPHQMEVQRIRFIIASYLRTRLEKIEAFTEYLLKKDQTTSNEEEKLMSENEFIFAECFFKYLNKHYHEEGLKYLPSLVREMKNSSSAEVKPNLNSTIFIRMIKTVPAVMVCDQIVELKAGSRHLLPYKDVKQLIQDGFASLM